MGSARRDPGKVTRRGDPGTSTGDHGQRQVHDAARRLSGAGGKFDQVDLDKPDRIQNAMGDDRRPERLPR